MALVKCPECGKENVSDSAESCPNCGYGIKTFFEHEQRKQTYQAQQALFEEKKKQEAEKLRAELDSKLSEIANLPYPAKPGKSFIDYAFNSKVNGSSGLLYATIASIILSFVFALISTACGSSFFSFVFIAAFVLLLVLWVPFLYIITKSDYLSALERYEKCTKDWEGEKSSRRERLIAEYDEYARNMATYGSRNMPIPTPKTSNQLKCPVCGCTDIERITTVSRLTSVAMVGVASGKIGKQYKCRKCKHLW